MMDKVEVTQADRDVVQAIQDCWFNRDKMTEIIAAHRIAHQPAAAQIDARCVMCHSSAPESFANACNRPECPHKPAAAPDLDGLVFRLERYADILDAALEIGTFTQAELNFAQTIAKLRVAMEAAEHNTRALRHIADADPGSWSSQSLAYEMAQVAKQALARITQETPNAG